MSNKFNLFFILLLASLLYLPFIGECFHSDDFYRLLDNSEITYDNFLKSFTTIKSDIFYRPINHLSFMLNYYFAELNPYYYGLTNFVLFISNLILIYYFIFKLLNKKTAFLTCLAIVVAYKTNNLLLYWIVGRTTLFYVFFSLISFNLVIRKASYLYYIINIFCLFLALLSKESAVIAPVIYILLIFFYSKPNNNKVIFNIVFCLIIYVIYFYLRNLSGAVSPTNAPDSHSYQLEIANIIAGLIQHLIKSSYIGTTCIIAFLIGRKKNYLNLPKKDLLFFILAFVISIAPTVLVTAKSHLYIYFPSIFLLTILIILLGKIWTSTNYYLLGLVLLIISYLSYNFQSNNLSKACNLYYLHQDKLDIKSIQDMTSNNKIKVNNPSS